MGRHTGPVREGDCTTVVSQSAVIVRPRRDADVRPTCEVVAVVARARWHSEAVLPDVVEIIVLEGCDASTSGKTPPAERPRVADESVVAKSRDRSHAENAAALAAKRHVAGEGRVRDLAYQRCGAGYSAINRPADRGRRVIKEGRSGDRPNQPIVVDRTAVIRVAGSDVAGEETVFDDCYRTGGGVVNCAAVNVVAAVGGGVVKKDAVADIGDRRPTAIEDRAAVADRPVAGHDHGIQRQGSGIVERAAAERRKIVPSGNRD